MIVFGGQLQNGKYCNELYSFDLQYMDWGQIQYKEKVEKMA